MGTAYDAIFGNNFSRICYSVIIEGIPGVYTDGPLAAVYTAYDNATFAGHTDFINTGGVRGGLSIHWDQSQRISPWKPFTEPSMVKFSIAPAQDDQGVMQDSLAEMVFKRTGGTETDLAATLDCDDTTAYVKRVNDFASSGRLYCGPETIFYSGKDSSANPDEFTGLTRGNFSPFATSSDARFARHHAVPSAAQYSLPPVIGTEPRTWVGRWAAIWIHIVEGDSVTTPELDGSGAHLAFAGKIVTVEDADGATMFTCEDVRRAIYESVVMRDPFRGRLAEGYLLQEGDSFGIETTRQVSGGGTTIATGNDLVVVPSGASGTNQVNRGMYSSTEMANVLNAWLQGEKSAGRILYNVRYDGAYQDSSGIRARMSFTDATAGTLHRRALLTSSGSCALALERGGWAGGGGTVYADSFATSGNVVSPRSPSRITITGAVNQVYQSGLLIEEPQGTWVSQGVGASSTLPVAFRDTAGLIDGVLKIGDFGYMRVGRVSDTTFNRVFGGVSSLFPDGDIESAEINLTLDDTRSVEVQQVLVMEGTFKTMLLRFLLSTGTSTFNDATYDVLDETLGCAIPYSILGDIATT